MQIIETIYMKQQQEWDSYFLDRHAALIILEQEQWEVATNRGLMDKKLIDRWKAIVHDERKLWIEIWGVNGLRYKQLKERHEKERQRVNLLPEEIVLLDSMYPPESWQQIDNEQGLIRQAYQDWKMPIPMPTRRRGVMQIDLFRLKWNGINPLIYTDQWKILDDDDIKKEFDCWRDLRTAHSVIMWFYDKHNYSPLSFERRMDFETEQFWKEIDSSLMWLNL